MLFRTEYKVEYSPFTLDPALPIVLAGSCFSQNIAKKMIESKWEAVNATGTLYNPISIYKAIMAMCDDNCGLKTFEDSLFQYSGVWHSNLFDSSFSAIEKEDCNEEFLLRQEKFLNALSNGKILVVTFGTSIYYALNSYGAVGNCHKREASLFERRRLSVEEIVEYWDKLILYLEDRYPGTKIIFTVSPVRHLKDGFAGNSRSKAILLLAVEELCRKFKNCDYFPAYEILNDDLRDYRFYASDLVHPSEEGVNYIWEKFVSTYIDTLGQKKLKQGIKEYKSEQHRPLTGALGKTFGNRKE